MIEVTLIGKFNTTDGMTLIADTADQIIRVGDAIRADGTDYRVKGFVCCSNAKPDDPVPIVVQPIS